MQAPQTTPSPRCSHVARVFRQHVGQSLLCYFTKKNGDVRRMLCVYGGTSPQGRQKTALRVWDCEKGEPRYIYLPGVLRVKVLRTHRHGPTYADIKRETDQLFY